MISRDPDRLRLTRADAEWIAAKLRSWQIEATVSADGDRWLVSLVSRGEEVVIRYWDACWSFVRLRNGG